MKTFIEKCNELRGHDLSARPLPAISISRVAKTRNRDGGLIEFGTYRGRVSALVGQLMRTGDEFHFIDVANYLEQDKLKEMQIKYTFTKPNPSGGIQQRRSGRNSGSRIMMPVTTSAMYPTN